MTTQDAVFIKHYSAAEQGKGAFDGGKITEIKPIDFPGGSSPQQRIGPLFYWAWASAKGDGVIGMHPHKGFEILSYVLDGEIGHSDTKGNSSRVGKGGAQVMQTGSGISHQEEMFGERTEFFQIWFEPELHSAIGRPPVYADFNEADFAFDDVAGGTVKRVIGDGGPVDLVAPIKMRDITVDAGETMDIALPENHAIAAVTVSGKGYWHIGNKDGGDAQKLKVESRDFAVIESPQALGLQLKANAGTDLRVVVVVTPLEVDYPLYRF